ncbi:esterase [Rhodococcus sp. 1163]|uniref:alpha/beta hydrolase n=1 Tax=unclassified Rhodococcus (in: high G+C Gram-positive bacteria) TaxID=192944 RepID=UPI000A048E3C|nr:alpha/beta hydrolase [Rhodococcus sp. 1163]ORI18798.1 esterase [Rhodococcus sp. 1163]
MRLTDEVQTLLDILNTGFPRVEQMTGADARAAVLARKQIAPNPEPVGSVANTAIDGPGGPLPLRIYQPFSSTTPAATTRPVVVFAHGGGFVFCDLDTHDELCRAMANAVDAVIVSVDYRLAPENPAPAAAMDVHAALEWVRVHAGELNADLDRVVVAGDSAGGNLAAVTALMDRDSTWPAIAGQVLIYPVIDDDFDTPSYLKYAEGYFNTRNAMQWYWQQYAPGGVHVADNPHHISPTRADTLAGLPPAIVITAGCDPLDHEGTAYAEQLRAAGVTTTHRRYDGIFHGFLTIPSLTITTEARTQLWADLNEMLA